MDASQLFRVTRPRGADALGSGRSLRVIGRRPPAFHGGCLDIKAVWKLRDGPEGFCVVRIQLKELVEEALRDLCGGQVHSIERTKQPE